VSTFLPWVVVGGVSMIGVPDVAALWVAGLGAMAAVLAMLSLITRRNSRHPLLIVGLFALGIMFLSWRIMPQTAGARALTISQAFAIVENTPMGVAPSAAVGSGIGPVEIGEVWGITKAYTTRVGEGPFPTELTDDTGACLREVGNEFGTTTGRPRRCGWLDLVALRYASRINGFTGLCITKLDVLDTLDTIKVCTHYKYKGELLDELPPAQAIFSEVEAVYEELPGWKTDITGTRNVQDLPQETIDYLNFIVRNVRVPISLISVGPKREEHIKVPHPDYAQRMPAAPGGGGQDSHAGHQH